MGNGLAQLMLLLWPAVCVAFFARLSVERALIWSIVGAYMLLPPITEFDLPLVPDMNKFSIPNIAVLVVIVAVLGLRPSFIPRHGVTKALLAAMLLGTVFTVLTNTDSVTFQAREDVAPINFPTGVLPGLRLIDIMSVMSSLLIMLIPFFLARVYLSSERGLRELLFAFMLAGLIYSIPALIEIRFSPQLNVWVYGFFQHSFEQMMRDGGFRPIVFMPHALWLALFFTMAMAAAAALMRAAPHETRWRYMLATGYLVVVVYLCKSMASQMYVLLLLPLIVFAPAKWQIRTAFLFAVAAIVYPMLRNIGVIPLDFIIAQLEVINPARAHSLQFRFINEEILLERAAERPVFGWGGWGRNLMHDPLSGSISTVADGRWILVFGIYGWFGYIAQMGLVCLPLALMAWITWKRPDLPLSPMITPLCLMLGVTVIDMLLNDTLVPMTLLMMGAIVGYAERLVKAEAEKTKLFPDGPVIGRAAAPRKRTVM